MCPVSSNFARTRLLLALAAPAEARAALAALRGNPTLADQPWQEHILRPGLHLLVTGVGKANAAAAVARVLDPERHDVVLSAGVAGALPGLLGVGVPGRLAIGDAVAATLSLFADEGFLSDNGFTDIASRGFSPGPPDLWSARASLPAPNPATAGARWSGCGLSADPDLLAAMQEVCDADGPVATVSTCSGTDAAEIEIVKRTGAIAEAMEGAAIAAVAARLGVRFAELRVISNNTGSAQIWDLPRALSRLGEVLGRLLG